MLRNTLKMRKKLSEYQERLRFDYIYNFKKIHTEMEWLITYRGTGQFPLELPRERRGTFVDVGAHLFGGWLIFWGVVEKINIKSLVRKEKKIILCEKKYWNTHPVPNHE